MGGKTGKRRAKFLLSHRDLVKRPLCRPIDAGCLLTHLIIKILNNPPTSVANLHHCCHSISTTRSLGMVGLLGTNAREPHLHVHPCSLQHNDADIQLDRRCGLTGLIAPPYPGFLRQGKREPPNVFVQRYSSPKKLHRCLLWARHDYLHALTRGFAHKNTNFSSSKGINLQNVDGRSQIWRGFSRQRSVKFHPSAKNSILACKIGQPFN